jgi:hypothetical protein
MAINPQIRRVSYTTRTAGNAGFSSATRSRAEGAVLEITDWRMLLRELRKVDKEMEKQLKRRFREIGNEVRNGIREQIKTQPPLSGMRKKVQPGRVTWGQGKPAKSAIVRMPRGRKKGQNLPVAQIMVGSPATVIADMAGKSNRETAKRKITAEYPYSRSGKGTRRHRINPIGSRKFINSLDNALGGRASRMVYVGAESKLDQARNEMQEAINYASAIVNKELRDVSGR